MSTALIDLDQRMPILDGMRYFYSRTDACNYMPTMKITMKDPVELPFLQAAAEVAMARYRHTRLVVVRDEEKFYLADNRNKPKVHVWDGKRRVAGTEENNGHLTWIGVNGSEIIIDFFHGIADLHGMLPFAALMLQEYCHLCYGEAAVPEEDKFAPTEEVEKNESRDSFSFVDADLIPKGRRKPRPDAFQLTDDQMEAGYECYAYSLKVDAQQFDDYMRRHGSSRTAVMALFMNQVIAERNNLGDTPVISGVGADVRKIYGAETTLRDCTDMLPVWYHQEIRDLPWDEQLKRSRTMIVDAMEPEPRLTFAADSIRNNQLLDKRIPTLEGKQALSLRANMTTLFFTYGLSNIGKVSFGDAADAHIASVDTAMSANTFPIMMEVLQYKNEYHITYCTRLHNDPYLKKFHQKFLEEGIPCTCEKQDNYLETLAVF